MASHLNLHFIIFREDSLVPPKILLQDSGFRNNIQDSGPRNNIDTKLISSRLEPPVVAERMGAQVNYKVASPEVRESKPQKMRRRKLQDRHSFELENVYDDYFDELLREL